MLRFACRALLFVAVAGSSANGQVPAQALADSLLEHLTGDWNVVGQVGGRPANYTLVARRVLAGRFVELHMTDVAQPPQYESRVFIGVDTVPGQVVVHWLDSFGGAFSVPAGKGSVVGDTLRFEFAYSTGPFRDTFVYHRVAGTWTFRLEQSGGSGKWRPFAAYEVGRPPAPQ